MAGQVKAAKPKGHMTALWDDAIRPGAMASQQYFEQFWKGGLNGNKKNITEIMNDGAWHGRRCFIVAGGPSVNQYDFAKLNKFLAGECAIGINHNFEWFPGVKINVMSDYTLYQELTANKKTWASQTYHAYRGIKLWVDHMNGYLNDCCFVRSIGRNGISWTLKGIYSHAGTGYSAINIALALGASPIYLIGYDLCQDKKGDTHFHGYPTTPSFAKSWEVFNAGFDDLDKRLQRSGKTNQIINLSPITKMRAFERGSLLELEAWKRGES